MACGFRYWCDTERSAVAAAALALLEHPGVRVEEPESQTLLRRGGAHLEGARARIPASLVEAALRSAPPVIDLYGREGQLAVRLAPGETHFGAHVDAPEVLDPVNGERRPCCQADVTVHARLIDALPNLAFVTASGLIADRLPEVADRASLACCLVGSTKPVLAMPLRLDGLADCREMAALAAGGHGALRERPLLAVYAEPQSPLVHPGESLRKLLYCAEHAIPLVYSGFAAMGATAPQSPTGIVAQLCAETLSGLVIHQLRQPGAPFVFGGMASLMDMRTTLFTYGAPEFVRGNSLLAEMAAHFGLPSFGTAGTSDAQCLDGQAVLEITSSSIMAVLCGAGLVHDVGLLGSATLVVPEAIVLADEIIGLIRRLASGPGVSDQDLALDVLAEVGPGGEFVTHSHTLRHFREVGYSALLFRGGARAWGDGMSTSFEQRLRERTCHLIDSHQPEPLPMEVADRIQAVVLRAEERQPC
jgi:trimethylamine---corrinoid protein Co-methyltransferase